MDINFVKLQSCGKDFIILDGFKNVSLKDEHLTKLSKKIANRHFGVGAVGFLLIDKKDKDSLGARLFNNKGHEINVSPDALLCLGRYCYDAGFLGGKLDKVKTRDGIFSVKIIDNENISVNLGTPFLANEHKEIIEDPNIDFTKTIVIDKKNYTYTPMELINFHSVFYTKDFDFNFKLLSKKIIKNPDFPRPPHVTYFQIFSREEILIKSREPASGMAMSSGSCSAAAVITSVLHGFTERTVFVRNHGGNIFVNWDKNKNHIYITAPVEYTFTGKYYFNPEETNNTEK